MCIFKAPKVPKQPQAAQTQPMLTPKEMPMDFDRNRRRRRGMWANIFTSPSGTSGPPVITGGGGGMTGVVNG